MATNIKEIKILDANGNIINPSSNEKLDILIDNSVKGLHNNEAWVNINYSHYENHEGNLFVFGYAEAGIASGQNRYFCFNTGNNTPHITFEINSNTDLIGELYENQSFSGGTILNLINKNRISMQSPPFQIHFLTTLTVNSNNLLFQFRKGNTTLRSNFESRDEGEWILKPNTNYVVRLNILNNGTNYLFGMSLYV